jgi:hypothetical protein
MVDIASTGRCFGLALLLASAWGQAGSIALFNGQNLDGWKAEGGIAWTVTDQAIVASGSGDGFLVTENEYRDFQLSVEFWVDATTNSGIFIRCRDRSRIHPETCYELNIWDDHPQQDMRTGAVVMHVMPPLARVETKGRWNNYEITAKGASIEVKVNGVTTAVLQAAESSAGPIALQHWGSGTVKFRKVELREL